MTYASGVERFGKRHAWLDLTHGGGPDIADVQVPSGKVLVLGDHRGNSLDGFFGWVDADRIYRAMAVYYRRGERGLAAPVVDPVKGPGAMSASPRGIAVIPSTHGVDLCSHACHAYPEDLRRYAVARTPFADHAVDRDPAAGLRAGRPDPGTGTRAGSDPAAPGEGLPRG